MLVDLYASSSPNKALSKVVFVKFFLRHSYIRSRSMLVDLCASSSPNKALSGVVFVKFFLLNC